MNFYNNLLYYCGIYNTNPSAVAAAIGLSNAAATKWKKGGIPHKSTLIKIAMHFGISVEELLADNENARQHEADGLSDREREVLEAYRNSPEARARIEFEVEQYKKKTAPKD